MAIPNRIKAFGLILFVITGYALFLLFMWISKALSRGDFISNITIFVGWIVALLTAGVYLNKTRKDNQKLKKEEIRRSLEIDAFREINRAVTSFGTALSPRKYIAWPQQLGLHRKNPKIFKFNTVKMALEVDQQQTILLERSAEFILAIEANEIAVIQFDHLRKYIQFMTDNVSEMTREFRHYLMMTKTEALWTEPRCSDFEERCKRIFEKLDEIGCYLFDYRIELMNSMLGETFDSQVPIRKPRDPKYKTLTEVAIREEVEKEAERRELKFLEQSRGKKHPSPKGPDNQ